MASEVDPNKIDDRRERRAERLSDRLEEKGVGHDDARRRALEEVARDPSAGGSHTGGEPKQGANHERDHRRGSDKEAG